MVQTSRQQPRLVINSSSPDDKFFLEEIDQTADRLSVQGWFFSPAEAVVGAKAVVYTPSSRRLFNLNSGLLRTDVGKVYGCANAYNSGFSGSFPLDQSDGAVTLVEVILELGAASREVTIQIQWKQNYRYLLDVFWHSLGNLNAGDIKWAAAQLIRGRLLHVWREMRKAYRGSSTRETSDVNLSLALGLIRSDRLVATALPKPVDVVVPVYNGIEHLDLLFESLSRNTAEANRIILIDDCSPDPMIRPRLLEFQKSRPNVVVILLEENLGFVGAVNRGAEATTGDFVLLNTDVVVPPLWLERLFAPLHDDPKVASVTPFSNAATICSFPIICKDNTVFNDRSVEEIDAAFRLVNTSDVTTDLPTAVGFCMAVRREIWLEIGPFDRETFKQGYGEENDWCRRAAAQGYRNVICANLYVYHKHGGSFEPESRIGYRERGLQEVLRRYPDYGVQVSRYVARDDLRPLRDLLTILVACSTRSHGCKLIVDHALGGGSNQYRERRISTLVERGEPVLLLLITPPAERDEHAKYQLDFRFRDLSCHFAFDDLATLSSLLDKICVEQIFVNSIVSEEHPLALVKWIHETKSRTNASLVLPFHDFYGLCPSYTLLAANGHYCGLPDETVCAKCLVSNSFAFNPTSEDIKTWRQHWADLIRSSDDVLCFSQSSANLVTQIYPESAERLRLLPHDDTPTLKVPHFKPSNALKIGVVGAIGHQKGSGVIVSLAGAMRKKDRRAQIVVFGSIDRDDLGPGVRVTGAYTPHDLAAVIEAEAPSLFFLPSIWPETFSYVAQELMNMKLPLVAFDIGAPAERLKHYPKGRLISLSLADDPDGLFEALQKCRSELQSADGGER